MPTPRIKAIAMDVDGVLTDGTFWWGPGGEEFKRFSFTDIMGVSLGKKAGLRFALISGEHSPLVDRYAQKMGIRDVYKGCKDKAAALRDFIKRYAFDPAHVCYIGDDVNDLGALEIAGLSVAPASAHESVRAKVMHVTTNAGGLGAVREAIDMVLAGFVRKECANLVEQGK